MSSENILSHDIFGNPNAKHTAFVCHGILGSRQNWRSIARRLVQQLPDLRVVTIDHRNHGDSPPLPGPHTVAACAEDLRRLADHIGPPTLLIGHSFGGKVVLCAASTRPPELEQVWVLDSMPGPLTETEAREGEVSKVLEALQGMPMPLASRQDIVALLTDRGFSMGLARWMTTNLEEQADGQWHWRFSLPGVQEMIEDYYPLDLWDVLGAPDPFLEVHLVRAGRSDRWTPDVLDRLENLPPGNPTHVHLMPDAGHWLHADDPHGLIKLIVDAQ